MRVIMPIFQFQSPLNWNDFTFSVGGLSIRHFDDWGTLTDRAIFSQCDRDNMRLENKGLVAEGNSFADEQYKLDSSLLLMTFRLLADENRLTPFVKYRRSTVSRENS